ncbi:MAG: phosphotransferase family protein, partial [Planctomycetota bacterium]
MEPIGRPGDGFRETLTRGDIERICSRHGLPPPRGIIPEPRGNENVAYHLDGSYFLAFSIGDDTRRKVEVLRLFEQVDMMPTPKVIGWSEEDATLQVPYMILERCPGERLDVVWEQCSPADRLSLLESLGSAMGRYHATTLADAEAAGRKTGMGRWVVDAADARRQSAREARCRAMEGLESLGERLDRWGIAALPLAQALKGHYARSMPSPDAPFAGPGLIHTEPWAEHFFMERTRTGFRLSGCADLEECCVADSLGEIVQMYVSMLALEPQYLSAFRKGYERSFPLPRDAERRLRAAAVDNDLLNVLWLLDKMENRPEWSFAAPWLAGHVRRL